MDRRWVQVATAVAAAAVLGTAVALVSSDGGRSGSDLLAPVSPETSASASPSTATSPTPDDPDRPVTSEPSSSPSAVTSARPSTAAPKPAPTRAAPPPSSPTAAPAPKPKPKPATSAPSSQARSTYAFDAAYGTDDPNTVIVQYGDSSSCPHQRVTYTVKESGDRAVVTLEADAMDPGRACTADYRQQLVTIRLQQPIAGRTLVDGHRNEPVMVDRSCRREFSNPPPPKDCDPT